jgi:type IV secretion system protein VirB6
MAFACATPQADVGMVQGLVTSVDCNVRGLSETAYGALSTANSPMTAILTLMLTLYIGFIGYRLLIGRTPLRVGDLTVSALKIGAILALATSWPTYQQVVFDTLFHGPEQLADAMMGAIQPSGQAGHGEALAGLQAAYDELQRSAAYFTQHSLSTASPLQGGNAGAALALNASALLMLLTSLGAILAAKIVLGLLLGLGPAFIALLLFASTRGLFEGWLRASIAFALAPLLAILGLVVQLTLIGPDLARLADLRSQGIVDLAPANAIFLLTLISTCVSLALAIAVGVIATGLRLPRLGPAPLDAAAASPSIQSAAPAQAQASVLQQAEPRALARAASSKPTVRRLAASALAPRVLTPGRRRWPSRRLARPIAAPRSRVWPPAICGEIDEARKAPRSRPRRILRPGRVLVAGCTQRAARLAEARLGRRCRPGRDRPP